MADSPFVQADKKEKRLKLFLWGPPGSGKTITALQFPSPVVIDTEKGTELYGSDFDFAVKHISTPDGVMDAVDWLLTNEHDYQTVVIDSATVYWEALQQKWSDIFLQRNKGGKGFKFDYYDMQMRDWGIVKAEHLCLNRKLLELDMNVVVTAHSKTMYDDNMTKIGMTWDCHKSLEYMFASVVQLSVVDGKFMGFAHKDRNNIFPAKVFEMSYKLIEDGMGKETMERKAVPVEYATDMQRDELQTFFVMFEMNEAKIKKMLAKYNCINLDELTLDKATNILTKFEEAHDKRKKKEA